MTDVSLADARLSLAESDNLESINNINSLTANYIAIFGIEPAKPEIQLPVKNLAFNNLNKDALENNPKINEIKYKIKF